LALNTRFDECGTKATHTEAGINFNNKVAVHSVQNADGIITSNDLSIEVNCVFASQVNVSTQTNVSTIINDSTGMSGIGQFEFGLDFYTNTSLSRISTEDDRKNIGETVFAGIKPAQSMSGIKFYVDFCEVTDELDQSITLIRDGCPNSSYVNVQIFSFIGEESIGFSYLAFRFLSDDYEKHQLLNLNCVVNVCLPDECPIENYCF